MDGSDVDCTGKIHLELGANVNDGVTESRTVQRKMQVEEGTGGHKYCKY